MQECSVAFRQFDVLGQRVNNRHSEPDNSLGYLPGNTETWHILRYTFTSSTFFLRELTHVHVSIDTMPYLCEGTTRRLWFIILLQVGMEQPNRRTVCFETANYYLKSRKYELGRSPKYKPRIERVCSENNHKLLAIMLAPITQHSTHDHSF